MGFFGVEVCYQIHGKDMSYLVFPFADCFGRVAFMVVKMTQKDSASLAILLLNFFSKVDFIL